MDWNTRWSLTDEGRKLMAQYLCRRCGKMIELDWWDSHHDRCEKKFNWGWVLFWLLVIIVACLFGSVLNAQPITELSKPALRCVKTHDKGKVNCVALDAWNFRVKWFTMAYGEKTDWVSEERHAEVPVSSRYYTLIVLDFYDEDKNGVAYQCAVYARTSKDGTVDYKPFEKDFDPNKDIPKPIAYRKACVVNIIGPEPRVFYEDVWVVDEDADFYWVVKQDYDKPVNIPKEKVLLQGEHRQMKGVNTPQRQCACPSQ